MATKIKSASAMIVRLALYLGLVCCTFIVFYRLGSNPTPPRPEPEAETEGDAAGSEDDPTARSRYEFMRIRDPQTNTIPEGIREKELTFASTLPQRGAVMSLGKGLGTMRAASWNQRGPYNVGGRTRGLAIDVTNENIILAGGISGGMWKSVDGGTTWSRTTSLSQPIQSVTCLAQDTRAGKRNIWYCGTGEYQGNSASGGGAYYGGDGIFKSSDGGASWSLLASTSIGRPQSFSSLFDYVWNVAVDKSNLVQDKVYAATYGTIYLSTDGGVTWTAVRGGWGSSYSVYTDVAVTSTGVAYATLSAGGPHQGIWRSTDGTTWTNITPSGWPASGYRRTVIGIAPSNENTVYFLAETPGSGLNNHSFWKYTYVSGDGSGSGGVWQNRSSALPAYGSTNGNFTSQSSYDLVAKVKPDDENCVFIGGTSLFRSTDGFATSANTRWIGGYVSASSNASYPNQHADQHSLAFFPSNPAKMLSGHDGGISLTLNNLASSVVWTYVNNGYFTTQFYTVAIDHGTSGDPLVIGGMQDNGTWMTTSTNSSGVWVNAWGGDGSYCQVAAGKSFYLLSSQNGVAYRTGLDVFGNWINWTRLDPSGVADSLYLFVNPFLMDPNNSKLLYLAGGDRIWRNSDVTTIPAYSNSKASANWSPLTNSAMSGFNITALGISKSPANRLYYGTWNGKLSKIDGANIGDPISTDIGTGKGLPANAYVSCIAVDPSDYNKAILVFSNYNIQSLFYTTDAGNTWQAVSGNLEQYADGTGNGPSCRWASMVPVGSSTMYFVGTSTGLYSTTSLNGSSTVWVQEGPSTIGNVIVDMIDTRAADGLVVAATHANGVFTANLSVPLGIPLLASPLNNATGIATATTLVWNASTGATTYRLQLSTSQTFATMVLDDSTITDTTRAVGSLQRNTKYYWRVAAKNNGGMSTWTVSWNFTTGGRLRGDVDGNGIVQAYDASLVLRHVVGLAVLTAPDALYAADANNDGSITPGDASLILQACAGLIPPLSGNIPDGGVSKAALAQATGVLEMTSPEPTANPGVVKVRIKLSNPANVYSVSTSTKGDFSLVSIDAVNASLPEGWQMQWNVVNDELRIAAAGTTPLPAGDIASIMVRMKNKENRLSFSTIARLNENFQSVGTFEIAAIPLTFALDQNYPNPFNPSTNFEYRIANREFVTLRVLDVLGREIATLINENQQPGSYSARWDASGFPSGVYFYQLHAGGFVETKKMILLR